MFMSQFEGLGSLLASPGSVGFHSDSHGLRGSERSPSRARVVGAAYANATPTAWAARDWAAERDESARLRDAIERTAGRYPCRSARLSPLRGRQTAAVLRGRRAGVKWRRPISSRRTGRGGFAR